MGTPVAAYLARMYTHSCDVRVRYGETDRMGFVYYGRYAEYFEVARVEALRSLGLPYSNIEEQGFMLPVLDLSVRYHRAARYDDLLRVEADIPELPGVRIRFNYRIHNAAGDLLTEATTTLVFVDRATGRPCRAPADLLARLAPFYR